MLVIPPMNDDNFEHEIELLKNIIHIWNLLLMFLTFIKVDNAIELETTPQNYPTW